MKEKSHSFPQLHHEVSESSSGSGHRVGRNRPCLGLAINEDSADTHVTNGLIKYWHPVRTPF